MTCNRIQPLLSAHVDGELRGQELQLVRAHLVDCATCEQEFVQLCSLKAEIGTAPAAEPAEDFERRLVSIVLGSQEVRQPRRLRFGWVTGFAVAAALFFGILWMRSERLERLAPTSESDRFELARDQAFVAGADPLSGGAPVLPASYGSR